MTDIEAKALALVNEVFEGLFCEHDDWWVVFKALCRAIEQHEAYKQKVDTLLRGMGYDEWAGGEVKQFIIPKPKPDPLADVLANTFGASLIDADELRVALEARGLEIREKGKCQ